MKLKILNRVKNSFGILKDIQQSHVNDSGTVKTPAKPTATETMALPARPPTKRQLYIFDILIKMRRQFIACPFDSRIYELKRNNKTDTY